MKHNDYSEYELSQRPALELFQSMGFAYLSPEQCKAQRGNQYDVLLKDILRGQLRKLNSYSFGGVTNEFSGANIERAMEELDYPLTEGLVTSSERIYNMLMLGNSYSEAVGEGRLLSFNLHYIDWNCFENNVFHVTEEFSVESLDKNHNARPDIVLFVNGIPLAVIECKSPEESVKQGITQTLRNQTAEYIPQLYKFSQILLSTNKNQVKYGTTNTPLKFWNVWKEEDRDFLQEQLDKHVSHRTPTTQDENLISLFHPSRFLEIIRYFILFDGRLKKICRYQQYFGIKETIATLSQREENGNRKGGVIWHTQGSGKSLTMVLLAKYLLTELSQLNPKVVIVTDRKELDEQIASTFAQTRLHPATATSGRHLVELISNNKADIVTTIVNKFNTAERVEAKYLSTDVFVLVDESHRTQYGQLSTKMHMVFPNACYIGFTGTPLMKSEKNTLHKFGGLIHKYTIKDGVEDKTIVPLIYEGRMIEQVVDEKNIDLWFEHTVSRLNEKQTEDLKRKWSSIRRLTSTSGRTQCVAMDIYKHYTQNIQPTGFRGMVATNFKKDAVRYLEVFETLGNVTCAVVISPPDTREVVDDVDIIPDDKVLNYWTKMMNQYGNHEEYEKAMKNKFVDGEIDLLIVCSKLLTGFDAPICQVLYIDKELKEHGLLQAIARTNRLKDGKDYGLIVDYRGLIQKLDEAMEVYSGAGLEQFEASDLKGTIVDVMSAVGNLRESSSKVEDLFLSIKDKNDSEAYEVLLADEELREKFYKNLSQFGRNLSLVLSSDTAYEAMNREELSRYQGRFIHFTKMRKRVKIRYFDGIDHAEYEPLMQNLLDAHLHAVDVRLLTKPVDILNQSELEEELKELNSTRSKADAITSRLTKSISEKYDENPAYYESFSKRIKDVLDEYKHKLVTDAEYLEKLHNIMKDYCEGRTEISYPSQLKNNLNAQAFYGVILAIWSELPDVKMEFLPEITLEITKIIETHSKVDFSTNKTIHDRIAQDMDDLFYCYEKEHGLKFDFNTIDMMIENVKTVALRRF